MLISIASLLEIYFCNLIKTKSLGPFLNDINKWWEDQSALLDAHYRQRTTSGSLF
jgi:hypothetical protein